MATRPRTRSRSDDDEDDLPVKDVSDIVKPRSYVFYGRSGTGKTTLAGSFPKPLLLLDVRDEGTDSIADVKGVKVMEINSWADFERAYEWLQRHPKAYKTVVIDTVTQLQQIAIEDILTKKKKDVEKAGDWGVMTKREWGDVSQRMKVWVVRYRNLPMEVVFLAQDRVFNLDDDSGEAEDTLAPEVGPGLSPSVVKVLNAAVSVIGNTFIKLKIIKKEVKGKTVRDRRVQFCLRLGPNPIYTTKLRKPKAVAAPPYIEDPTYEDIQDAIEGED